MSKTISLKKVAKYSEARIPIKDVTINNFVTTDNLLQNKLGITKATSLPPQDGNMTAYFKNNILVGNIRPYLKKIWFADRDGGNSADVLTIQVDTKHNPKFIYYALYRDDFFEHMMKGSKGTKMPRGDKTQIMDFTIPNIDRIKEDKIANILSSFDSKIELNNKINKELEAMAKTLYDYWFVQFDFPDENEKPYKSSGGKMVYSKELKREIPEGWEVCRLENIEDNIITGKTPPKINPEYFDGDIPFITIGDIRGNMHITSTEETLSKLGADYQSSKYINKGALCVSCIASPGLIGFATKLSQTNQQINSIECKKEENSFYLYFALNNFFNASKAKTGNTFPNMNKGDFADIKLIKPNEQILLTFGKKIKSSIEQIYINSKQNQELSKLRDWLLPMLMNGQVKVK